MPVNCSQPPEAAAPTGSLDGFVPFPPERAARYRAAGYWTGRTVDSVLRNAATTWPDRVAVVDAASSLTYSELDKLVDRAAGGFAALGIAPTDRVLLQLPNSCRFAVALFGLLRAGAIPVLCLPGHRLAELTRFAQVSGAVGLVIVDTASAFDYRSMAEQLVALNPELRHVIVDGDAGPFSSWSGLPAGDVPADGAGNGVPALLLVSGGTTGVPKLIPRTHDDYVYNATRERSSCAG